MSVLVSYPVTVLQYEVAIAADEVTIGLKGVEGATRNAASPDPKLRLVGRMRFHAVDSKNEANFINRGGSLEMRRPLTMLAGVLDVLRNEKPVFLREDGVLSTSRLLTSEAE